MTVINEGLLIILVFIVLAVLRVPIFVALALPAIVYALFLAGQPVSFPIQRMMRTVDSFTLLAIPLFIYVGSLMNHGNITERLFDFADHLVGHYRGGLAQVNIITSLIFSGISGSALADIGGVGKVLIETMRSHGYSDDYSAALTSASATVGPLFPPSIPLILFGIIAEISVLQLLLAGALPALLTVVILMIGTAYLAHRRGFPAKATKSSPATVLRSLVIALPAILTPVVLIGGMLGGYFGPTEAAAVTVVYILGINTVIYRLLEPKYIWRASVETAETTGVIVLILGAAGLFAWVLSIEQVDQTFADLLFSITTEPTLVMLLVLIMLLVLGLFLDPIAALVMVTPIIFPTLVEAGYHPIHIGVVTVYALMIGLITPPLGLSVYLSADIAGARVASVFRNSVPYYVILIVGLVIVAYVPEVSLYILRFV